MSERICRKCGESKPFDRFKPDRNCAEGRRRTCKDCDNIRYRARYAENHNGLRDRTLVNSRRWKYGVEEEDVDRLYEAQGGLCAICSGPIPRDKFDVDHDHRTNEVRGLLHRRCNLVAGFFDDTEDGIARVLTYLKNPPMRQMARKKAQ